LNRADEWGTVIPTSCCAQGATQCQVSNAFTVGCGTAVNDFISTSGNIIGAVALGVAGIEVCVRVSAETHTHCVTVVTIRPEK